MRILMLIPPSRVRGPIPGHSAHLVSALRDLGCEVETLDWGGRREDESPAAKVLDRALDVLRIRRRLRRTQFDVMVVKTAHDWAALSRDVLLLASCRRSCPRIVLQFHGSDPGSLTSHRWAFRAATSLLLRFANAAMVLSSLEQREWDEAHPGKPILLVDNAFVRWIGHRGDVESEPDRPNGGDLPVVLFVGRLIKEKGVFDLLEAAGRLQPAVPFRLLIVGAGDQDREIRRRVRDLGLGDRVSMEGHLDRSRLADMYHQADVFVLPSWREGFPTVVAEAMDAGLPIVATQVGGVPDHLQEGVNGLLVPPKSPLELARAIEDVLLDPALRAQMGTANSKMVDKFAPQAVARRYLNALRCVTNGK